MLVLISPRSESFRNVAIQLKVLRDINNYFHFNIRTQMKFYKIIGFLLLLILTVKAQPSWVSKTPEGYLNDFFVGRGIGTTKTEATQKAFEDAVISIMRNNTITVNYSENNRTVTEQRNIDETIRMDIVRKSVQELRFDGESKTINQLKQVETYYEQGSSGYEAFALLSLPKRNPISPPSSFSPVWRSVLLPGWGQLYKDQTFRGLSFMALTVGGVAGGLVFNQLSVDAANNALASRTQARRDYYNQDKKNYNTYSIISFIAGGVFYTWSIIDAIIVKQEDVYVQLQMNGGYCKLNFSMNF